jgi:hypothetical protein
MQPMVWRKCMPSVLDPSARTTTPRLTGRKKQPPSEALEHSVKLVAHLRVRAIQFFQTGVDRGDKVCAKLRDEVV